MKLGKFFFVCFTVTFGIQKAFAAAPQTRAAQQSRILEAAAALLDNAEVSYVYGGGTLGNTQACDQCNACLREKSPAPQRRQAECPVCDSCSLDCSHFVELVYDLAGLKTVYLTTKDMRELTSEQLLKRAKLVPVPRGIVDAEPGDLLVYPTHVVILEALRGKGRGDVIHVTSGLDIKGPGQGIQRERMVELTHFRGPLRRVLRHIKTNGLSP